MATAEPGSEWSESEVEIPAGAHSLPGSLALEPGTSGVVVFAHGSGSSRRSPRNRMVARLLNQSGLGTLLLDLLTEAEANHRSYVFDIGLLADRLVTAIGWLRSSSESDPALGLFGSSTGAAAALVAAATVPDQVGAVVSRGGRPDLAMDILPRVEAPTLLIVGGLDVSVLELNRLALAAMTNSSRIEVIPGAGHLFEEQGALGQVASLAASWFGTHLRTETEGEAEG